MKPGSSSIVLPHLIKQLTEVSVCSCMHHAHTCCMLQWQAPLCVCLLDTRGLKVGWPMCPDATARVKPFAPVPHGWVVVVHATHKGIALAGQVWVDLLRRQSRSIRARHGGRTWHNPSGHGRKACCKLKTHGGAGLPTSCTSHPQQRGACCSCGPPTPKACVCARQGHALSCSRPAGTPRLVQEAGSFD